MISLQLADKDDLKWAQEQVTSYHYLHKPVDVRCSCVAYIAILDAKKVGCLIFGRPESTRVNGWYGSVEDVTLGKCRITRWQVLNLARVWLHPSVQNGGAYCVPGMVPGFIDRRGVWHSSLASTVVGMALESIVFDYLVCKPPVWPHEPYEIREILSYCDTRIHQGTLYRAAKFQLIRKNSYGIETYARPVRQLTELEKTHILANSKTDKRCKELRAKRIAEESQLPLLEVS